MVALDWSWVTETYANLELVHFLNGKPLHVFQTMLDKGINSPLTSSAGRLFDAVAAAVGVCRESVGFEGQAAIELEALATVHFSQQAGSAYGFNFCDNCLNWKPLWLALLQDLAEGVSPGIIAARFHHAIANAVSTIVSRLCDQYGPQIVVLSGGVFQNCLLLEQTSHLLGDQGLNVISPVVTPANDGGISLGQAVVAFASSAG